MAERFPSLSSFLSSAKKVEKKTMEDAISDSASSEVKKILNDSALKMSVYNHINPGPNDNVVKSTAEVICEGVQESIDRNTQRVKSLLDDLFADKDLDKEREILWVNKLSKLFGIKDSLTFEEKSALIEQQLIDSPDSLNFATYLIESWNKSSK